MEALITYLLKQSPTIVLMGLGMYILYKERGDYKKQVAEKNTELLEMSSKVLKVAIMWEINSAKNTTEHELLITGVDSIKGEVKDLIQLANNVKDECTRK